MKRSTSLLALALLMCVVLAIFLIERSTIRSPSVSEYRNEKNTWSHTFLTSKVAYADFLKTGAKLSYSEAHVLAHIVGQILYEQYGFSGVRTCTDHFAYGCFHGFAEALFAEKGISAIDALARVCASDTPLFESACLHGVGHGILAYLGYDALEESLEICRPFQKGMTGACFGGVFMEYDLPIAANGEEPRPLDSTHPDSVCAEGISEEFKPACYFELPMWWRISRGTERPLEIQFEDDGRLCASIAARELRDTCYRGIGSIVGRKSERDVNLMGTFCRKMPTALAADACLAEALKRL